MTPTGRERVDATIQALRDQGARQANALQERIASEERAIQERAGKAKVQASRAFNQVRAYREDVDKAAKAAAALRPGPPAPVQARIGARFILHGPDRPRWGYGDQDATLEGLFTLQQRGIWLYDNLPDLDEAGRLELDAAEAAAWGGMIARAKIVAGEI